MLEMNHLNGMVRTRVCPPGDDQPEFLCEQELLLVSYSKRRRERQ